MTTPYWTLLERDSKHHPWAIAFGDYDRKVVFDEKQYYRDGGRRASDLLIIRSGDTEAEIWAEVSRLNVEAGLYYPK